MSQFHYGSITTMAEAIDAVELYLSLNSTMVRLQHNLQDDLDFLCYYVSIPLWFDYNSTTRYYSKLKG